MRDRLRLAGAREPAAALREGRRAPRPEGSESPDWSWNETNSAIDWPAERAGYLPRSSLIRGSSPSSLVR
jgi:hypothetical protein